MTPNQNRNTAGSFGNGGVSHGSSASARAASALGRTPGNGHAPSAFDAATGAPRSAPSAANFRPTVNVRYVEASAVQVRGPVTGQMYQFSAAKPLQAVDARDAAGLLGTRFFRRG